MNPKPHYLYVSVLSALGLTLSTISHAQSVTQQNKKVEERRSLAMLEEIVVTAQRKEESLQDVPISISVFNEEQIRNRNIVNASDLAAYTPSLSADTRFGPMNSSFAIRGFVQDINTPPSVGVYFADVVAPRAASPNSVVGNGAGPGSFFDLQNVQILKGPQGTLFGRNTTGGAILLVPQKPTDQWEGYTELSAGDFGLQRAQGVLNMPITDNLRVRMGVESNHRDGTLENTLAGGDREYGEIDYLAARLSVVADITDDIENYAIVSYLKTNSNGQPSKVIACNDSADFSNVYGQMACGHLARAEARGDDFHDIASHFDNANVDQTQWQLINTTSWEIDENTRLKNIISYAEINLSNKTPVFATDFDVADTAANVFFNYPTGTLVSFAQSTPIRGGDTADQSTFTEELQLQGTNLGNKLEWQTGIYFEKSDPKSTVGSTSPILLNCTDLYAFDCTNPLFGGSITNIPSETSFETRAVYAQSTYHPTETVSLTAGLRYTEDKTEAKAQQYVYALPAPMAPVANCLSADLDLPDCAFSLSHDSDAVTGLIGINYTPTDDALLYAKYSRGYRSGGIVIQAPEEFRTFEPEQVDTYEIGTKLSFNGALSGTLGLSLFYNDFQDQQVSTALTSASAFFSGAENLGKSEITGAEIESTFYLTENFRIDLSYAHLETEVKEVQQPKAVPGFNTVSLVSKGDELPLTPSNKYSITANYKIPLAESIGAVSLGATYSYTGEQLAASASPQLNPDGFNYIEDYSTVNMNVRWNSVMGSHFDLLAFADNLLDEEYYTAIAGLYSQTGFETAALGAPRTYGLSLRYNFD